MKKLLGKIGKRLYLRFGEPDLVALTREQLRGKDYMNPLDIEKSYTREQVDDMVSIANDLLKSDLFEYVFRNRYNVEVNMLTTIAKNWEHNRYHRYRIDALYEAEQVFKAIANMYQLPNPATEKNKYDII